MAKKRNQKPKRKTDRQVLKKLFPPEVVQEVDNIIREVDSDVPVMKNPYRKGARPIKPWSKTWVKEKG
jgi:hypothetical protein